VTELWRVLSGQAQGRQSDADITVFDSVGFALEDYSALRYLARVAGQLDLGQPLPLIPALANPRDLFALVAPVRPALPATAAASAIPGHSTTAADSVTASELARSALAELV
jgi:ornithine cyclodeaminase